MTRVSLVVTLIVGGLVTAWVGRQYQGTDSLALVLVALIAIAFVVGLIELWLRASAIASLTGRAQALGGRAEWQTLHREDAELARLVHAKQHDATSQVQPLNFAPFAVGLVVLLGLLGTFMGLVDTIAGAQNALGATSDVDSLRAALLAPMHGLTRAFGTSVAGVAASALLGIAQVMVRRDENALMHQLAGINVVKTDESKPEVDQLSVLREILAQGVALNALLDERLEERLGDQLAKTLDTHETARAAREKQFFGQLVSTTESELAKALSTLDSKLRESSTELTSTIATAVDAIGAKTSTFIENLEGHTKSLVDRADKDAESVRAAAKLALEGQVQASKTAAAETAKALEATTTKVLQGFTALESSIQEREAARQAAEAERQALDAKVGERLVALTDTLEQSAERQHQWVKSSADALKEASDRAGEAWSENALQAQRSASEAIEHLANSATERLAEQQERLLAFESTLVKEREQEQALAAERSEALARTLESLAQERAQGIAALEESLDDGRAKRESEIAERLSTLAAAIDGRFAEYIASLQTFEAKLAEVREHDAKVHSEAMSRQAQEFAQALESTAEAVQKAAGHVGAGGMELEAVAEMFATSVDTYRDTSERWLERLAEVAQRPVGDGAAPSENAELMGGYLDQTRAAFDESLKIQRQMQQEMFSELRTLRGEAS